MPLGGGALVVIGGNALVRGDGGLVLRAAATAGSDTHSREGAVTPGAGHTNGFIFPWLDLDLQFNPRSRNMSIRGMASSGGGVQES